MRTVQASSAFAPASVARRLRTGLWVTGQYQEMSVSEMTDSHAQATLEWLTDKAPFYGSLLLLHPDEGITRRNRGYFVADTASKLANPRTVYAVLAATRLMRDLEARRAEVEERKAVVAKLRRRPGTINVPVHAEVSFGGVTTATSGVLGYLHREFGLELEPAPGREKVLELDDGTKIVIGNQQVKVETTGGNVTTISR